jgi:hypothetical protein
LDVKGTNVTGNMTLTLLWTDEAVSVLASSREIPAAPAAEVTAIAPVAVMAVGELTAGPVPQMSRSGKISFFWNGAPVKSGKLSVFDAAGKVVGKVAVSDNSGIAGRRPVAAWNLKDSRGRPVAEGVYLAKGVIATKSGKSERVSVLLGVR